MGPKITQGSYGVVHEAKIIRSINNREIDEKAIVIKFVDCFMDNNSLIEFERELLVMLNLE